MIPANGRFSQRQVYPFPFIRLAGTFLLIALLFDRWSVYNQPQNGLDGSWTIGLHLARQLGLIHGTEFVFTYGPMSWLITRLPIAAPSWGIVALDFVRFAGMGLVVWWALGSRPQLIRYLVLFVLAVIHRQTSGEEHPFVLYFLILAALACHRRTGQRWLLPVAISLSILTFYLKVNVGLVTVLSVLFYVVAETLSGRIKLVTCAAALLGTFGLLGVSAWFLPVKLGPYLLASWQIIDSYNDVMYLITDRRILLVGLGITALSVGVLFYVIWRIWKSGTLKQARQQDGTLLLLVLLQCFVLFKESFVRADLSHIGLFFKYALLPYGLLALFAATPLLRQLAFLPIALITGLAPICVPYHWESNFWYRWVPQWSAYIQDVVNPQKPSLTPSHSHWPERWLTQLRGKRVDCIPYDIAAIYAHRLTYAPRPVIQTYQVTNAYLDSLNANHFLSERAPDALLINWSSTDDRSPFSDETVTKLALLQTYAVADTSNGWLFLQKRPNPLKLEPVKTETQSCLLNQTLPVQDSANTLQLWQLQGHYNLAGHTSRLLWQPPHLKLELTYKEGNRDTVRTALPLLKAGLLFPAHPRSLAEFAQYFSKKGRTNNYVTKVRLLTEGVSRFGYKEKMSLTKRYYRLD
ncbi:hypothetical protein [Tellurirhabdus bombi]|uniref:hypothetical protein n=1 Tax=Tellurirhabdus bombi TaxID=2907205 RepID=UPI001F21D1CD|nr:hypothetical protein [Tellurirhabdus bombi]